MRNVVRSVVLFVVVSLAVAPLSLFAATKSRKAQAIIDGDVTKNITVYSFSGDDYFTIKDIAGIYGSHLIWKPVSGKATLLMDNDRFDIFIKSSRATFGDKKVRMSIPTRYNAGVLYVPAVFIQSADFTAFTAAETSWNSDEGILTVEHKVTVGKPRCYTKAGSTKIVIELLDDLSGDWSQKDNSVVLSVPRGRIHEGRIDVDNGAVKDIEMRNKGRLATVTVHLAPGAGAADRMQAGSRLILTVQGSGSVQQASSSDTVSGAAVAAEMAVFQEPATPRDGKKRVVVLDAGHGGEDPGAVGKNHTKEKDLNLAIVKELKKIFENDEEGNWQVILTRTDDTFIPLVERTSLANEKKADLFVSVHCNADWPRKSSGFEIYFLSEQASDDEAAATAMLENAVVELEGKPSKKRARLQDLLWSLMVNEFINESSELCSFITGEVTHRIRIDNRGVKQAGFYVLRGAEMPAVLVECAFVSNIKEEAMLKTRKFQMQMADSIYEGVKKYVSRKDMANARTKKEYPDEQ